MLNRALLYRPKLPAGGFHPIGSLVPGGQLKAWWDADTGVSENFGVATDWTDRVAGIVASSLLAVTPAYSATSFNGKAGFTFDGVDDCLVSTSFAALPNGAVPGELWVLADDTNVGSGTSYLINYGGVATAQDRALLTTGAGRSFRINDRTTNLTVTNLQVSGKHVLQGSWNGTEEQARIDGYQSRPSQSVIATLATGTTRLRIGAGISAAASSFFTGVIRHAMVTTLLLPRQRLQLEAWLAHDGGIADRLPSSHPYRSRRP